ncbi:MAG: pyridoxamine 5-phosphate oxidase-related, FMN-binding protein [Conexibacter sp.]|nr:pyridoxamine 5-phosphate oxidase-related, FMN-binding protein [Conexibacter sp.]
MSRHYGNIAFTERVRDAQTHYGSRAIYARGEARAGRAPGSDALTATELAFLAERDGFYLATVSETGWPYVQFRGGPAGFVRVLDDHTLAWADFRGNLQYISTGNVAGDDRVALFFMDYAHRRRLKLFGRASVIEVQDDPDLARRLAVADYDADVERAVLVAVEAYDWNCPQHITQRFTIAELDAVHAQVDA